MTMNENQKVVLNTLINKCSTNKFAIYSISSFQLDCEEECAELKIQEAYEALNQKQEFEVLAEFAKWGLEDE